MSTMYDITEFVFHNRKPSKKQVMACISNAIKHGSKALNISWGENCLEFTYNDKYQEWYGYGWIKNLGGSDIAMEINRTNRSKFVEDHFKFIHIG